ncbi:MAG: hypothetical protein ACYDH9_23455 [Limisphaerales bacterium]
MQTILSPPAAENTRSESNPIFQVVIAYDDFSTGLMAKEFYDRTVRDHKELFRFICHLWKFRILSLPPLRDQAAVEAETADMVVIAAHEGKPLSSGMRRWIEFWLPRKAGSGALVALLDVSGCGARVPGRIDSYLRNVAEMWRVRFFCKEIRWRRNGSPSRLGRSNLLTVQNSPLLGGMLAADPRYTRPVDPADPSTGCQSAGNAVE